MLISPGVDTDLALQKAAAHGHGPVAEALLPSVRDQEGALVALCLAGMNKLAIPLIHAPAPARALEAAAHGRGSDAEALRLVRVLVDQGAPLSGPPLLAAVEAGYLETARFLANQGISLEVRNRAGETPFLVAARKGSKSLVEEFLNRGADGRARNLAGQDVLTIMATRLQGYQMEVTHLKGMRSYQPGIPKLIEEARIYAELRDWLAQKLEDPGK